MTKKHQITKFSVFAFLMLSLFSAPALSANIDDYLKKGEYAQARGALQTDLLAKKPEAFYDLIRITLTQKEYNETRSVIKRIINEGIGNGYKEAELVQKEGFNLLQAGKNAEGRFLLVIASETNTSLRKENCQTAFKIGNVLLSQRQYDLAVNLFIIASENNEAIKKLPAGMQADFDSSLNQKIGQTLNQVGQNSNDQLYSLALIALACKYDIAYTANLNKRLVDIYKDKPRSERSRIVSQYEILITGETKKILLPDPVWEKIPGTDREIIGEGIETIVEGVNNFHYEEGWKLVFETDPETIFEHYNASSFQKYKGKYEYTTKKSGTTTTGLKFKIPKGRIVKFWAEKKTYY